jgi:hypothetical protein
MRIGRAVIIPAILALSAAGSILAAAAPASAAAPAPAAHAQHAGPQVAPNMHYHA